VSAGASVRVCGGEKGGVGRAACSWIGESVRVREGLTSRERRDILRLGNIEVAGEGEGKDESGGNGTRWRYKMG